MSPCLTSCCPCRGAPGQAPRQRQHEVRQGNTHDSDAVAIRGPPLLNQQRKIWRWPTDGKGTTTGATVRFIMNQWGVSPCCITICRKGPSPPRHKCTTIYKRLVPSFPNPPLPYRVTIVGPTTAIATHNLAEPLCPRRSRHHWHLAVYQGPDITTVWACPTPADTHTARRCTNNTHNQCQCAVCHSSTHMSTK